MPMTTNQRPGVYSAYTIDSGYATPRARKAVALAVRAHASLAGSALPFTGYEAALLRLGVLEGCEKALRAIKILFESGIATVLLSVADGSLADALALLEGEDDVGAVVCDTESEADLAALAKHLKACAADRRERVAFVGAGREAAGPLAKAANNERIILCCPAASPAESVAAAPVYAAAAMAGVVTAQNDPVHNWNGEALESLVSCDKLPETDIQALLAGGVTVLEERGGQVACVRAVTTRTAAGGVADNSLRSLNAILIIDDMMETVRDSLAARLRGTRVSLDTVRTQVAVELAAKRDEGVIEAFSVPSVRVDPSDPAVCLVEIAFTAAHVLSQIHITAHVAI